MLIFERNLKRKINVSKKFFTRIQTRLNLKQEDVNNRHERFFKAVEFFR